MAYQPGELALMSSDSLDVLVAHYEKALGQLGAQAESSGRVAGNWAYQGTFDGGKSIEIAIANVGGTNQIAVAFDL